MYNYDDFKEWLSTPDGQRSVVRAALAFGQMSYNERSVELSRILTCANCDSWEALAVVDHLVHLKMLELAEDHETTQYKKYSKGTEWYL